MQRLQIVGVKQFMRKVIGLYILEESFQLRIKPKVLAIDGSDIFWPCTLIFLILYH
jgi:hypothetical protein